MSTIAKTMGGGYMVTIKEIARLSGVSYSTVSKALNDSPAEDNTLSLPSQSVKI